MKALQVRAEWNPREEYRLTRAESESRRIHTSKMVWQHPTLELVERQKPSIELEDVLIQVKSCSICGSDVIFTAQDEQGYMRFPGYGRFDGIVLGHEFAGIVADRGANVKTVDIGDYVTVEESITCGRCDQCRGGNGNNCEELEMLGVTVDGGMAEYVRVPARLCWKLDGFRSRYPDEDQLFDAGALVQPNAVVYEGLFEKAKGIKPGQNTVVFGCGPIGLFGIAQLKAAGAAQVIAFELSEERRERAKKIGADYVYDPNQLGDNPDDIAAVILQHTEGWGADLFLESSGAFNSTFPIILGSLNRRAKIVLLAWPPDEIPTDYGRMFFKGARVFTSMGHTGGTVYRNVIRLIQKGLIRPEIAVSSRFDINDGIRAFSLADERKEGKIILRPNCSAIRHL
jgi:threonine dehydrogenase-like Zn-dependent dehydrogenase